MSWQNLRKFFTRFIYVTINGLLLYVLNRNREELLSKKFQLWFIFIYGAIVGSIRVLLQFSLQVISEFFQLTREIFINMIVFPFFITVFGSMLLTLSARGLGGKGKYNAIVNYMFYANVFHLIIPFIDFIFNRLLNIPYIFNFGFWGPDNGWIPQNPWHALFFDKLVGLSAGIIFMYFLIIIRTPGIIRFNFKINFKKSLLTTASLFVMFWIIFLAWPFWFYHLATYLSLPTLVDGYTFVFIVCILIAFPYFWKNFKKEKEVASNFN